MDNTNASKSKSSSSTEKSSLSDGLGSANSCNATATTTAATTHPTGRRLIRQLEDANLQLQKNIYTMQTLHMQWMNYLVVLSVIVILLSMYQIYINNNNINLDALRHTTNQHQPPRMILLLSNLWSRLQNSMTYIVSTIMSMFLSRFIVVVKQQIQQHPISASTTTTLPKNTRTTAVFRHFYFRMTQLCILPTMILYYYHSIKTTVNSMSTSSSSTPDPERTAISTSQPQFPIVLVYVVIATISICFIQYQSQRSDKNLTTILTLQHEIQQQSQSEPIITIPPNETTKISQQQQQRQQAVCTTGSNAKKEI